MGITSEMMDLSGRTAVITGAAGSLGGRIADSLAELGADLILLDRPGTDLESICDQLQNQWGRQVSCHCCDLERGEQRREFAAQLATSGINLNILVHNAAFVGTSSLDGWSEPFEKQSVETWRRALEVNITAVFDLSQQLMPLLEQSEGASIINIASMYGEHGPDWLLYEDTDMANPAAYSVSKGGLIQFTRWLATTVAPKVRVNSISPGGIFRDQPEVFVNRYESRTPLKRMATEDDMRGAIVYLASDMSAYVTGQNLVVDGGWSVW